MPVIGRQFFTKALQFVVVNCAVFAAYRVLFIRMFGAPEALRGAPAALLRDVAADAAVLPYRSATGSAVAAQALGWGLPLVGSAVGGIAEVVEEGVNGLLVPPEDPEALAAALTRVADGSLRARLAGGARAASRRWNWASYAEVLEELVARLVTASGSGPRNG